MVWLVKDSCGIACVLFAWLLMAFSQYAFLTLILLPQVDPIKKYGHIIFFELFSILALIEHIRTIFTDPGSVPRQTATPEVMQNIRLTLPTLVVYKCSECCAVKPYRAHHCSICQRCIRKMDHHCPWVNNCVGERNQKYFVAFILYISIISFHALIMSMSHFFRCLDADMSIDNPCTIMTKAGKPSPERLIMLVLLTFSALLFAMFTLIMFSIQVRSIWNDRRRKDEFLFS